MNTCFTDGKIERLEQENARLREVVKMHTKFIAAPCQPLRDCKYCVQQNCKRQKLIRAGKESLNEK
jgi:hypothetical protein